MINFILMEITVLVLIVFKMIGVTAVYVWLKGLASIFFIVTGVESYKKVKSNRPYFIFILIGLIFSFCGDVFLGLPSKDNIFFYCGVGSFSFAHIMYSIGFCLRRKISFRDIFTCSMIIFPMLLFELLGDFTFDGMQNLVIIYTILISFMVCKSLSLLTYYRTNEKSVIMTILGAVLFLISDFILLFVYFSNYHFVIFDYANLLIYYNGQGILALSLGEKFNKNNINI